MNEFDGDLFISNGDGTSDEVHHVSFFGDGELWPALVKVVGFGGQVLLAEAVDLQEGHLSFDLGKFGFELLLAFDVGGVEFAEAVSGDLLAHVELEDVFGLLFEPDELLADGIGELPLLGKGGVHVADVSGEGVGVHTVVAYALSEQLLEVFAGDAVAALGADVFGGVAEDIHLAAAGTAEGARENVDRGFSGLGFAGPALVEDVVALLPELLGHDGFDAGVDVLALGLELPFASEFPGEVAAVESLCGGVADETFNGGVAPLVAIAGAVTAFVEEPCDSLATFVLGKQLVDEAAHRGLLGLGHEALAFPFVAIGGASTKGLAELGPDSDGGAHAVHDFLALPLGHAADHIVEKPPRRAAGVDTFLEGDEVRVVGAEVVGEIHQLAGIAGEAGELGKDEAGDVAALHVGEHPLRLGVLHDRLPGDPGEVVDLDDLPTFCGAVVGRACAMVLGAVTLSLVLGRDAHPHTDALDSFSGKRQCGHGYV